MFANLPLVIRTATLGVGLVLMVLVSLPLWLNRHPVVGTSATLRNSPLQIRIVQGLVAALCAVNLLFVLAAVVSHLGFPLHLNLMEGTVLQHFDRAVQGLPIYPEPSPNFVPLAYNVGYYLLAKPFAWLFGTNLFTLRLVALLGGLGSGALVYRVVYEKTESKGWGFIALGLFAAAYGVMEAYLDTAHSDSWLLCMALLGTYLIDRKRSKRSHLLGLLALIASFWFKQHGALFVLGGLVYLFWCDGVPAGLGYALVAVLLGPVLYIYAGPVLFGAGYHFFTWFVPRHWSELNISTFVRYFRFVSGSYLFLALAALLFVLRMIWHERELLLERVTLSRNTSGDLSSWHIQWLLAMLSGFMGTLDPGSANNVFISLGTWCIIVGVWSAKYWLDKVRYNDRAIIQRLQALGLLASLGLFAYNPLNVIPSFQARAAYQDFIQTLHQIDGPVYAPFTAYIQDEGKLYPNAHWVALEDIVRGPKDDGRNAPETRRLLHDAIAPNGNAYLLTNMPIEQMVPAMAFLGDYYVLDKDFGPRFVALEGLPGRFGHGYPQYLYRHKNNIGHA